VSYPPGTRIAIEHTSDPHTLLRPGDEGTVVRYDETQRRLDVAWDSGSRLAMLFDAGDRVRTLPAPSRDHLGIEHIMIGDVGVFAGDWACYDHDGDTRYPTGFVGTLTDIRNGFAVFRCDREVAEAIVTDQQRLHEAARQRLRSTGLRDDALQEELDRHLAPMTFDGNDLVVDDRLARGHKGQWRISADENGRYLINEWAWTWTTVHPTDCDQIVGVLPSEAEQPARIPLVHSDLSVPHQRLAVSSMQRMSTATGAAFTATVRLDGAQVGTAENDGQGKATRFRLYPPSQFDWGDMEQFVAGCRYRARPVTLDVVLNHLVTEFHLGQEVNTVAGTGSTLARLVDDDGYYSNLVTVHPVPGAVPDWVDLAAQLAALEHSPDGTRWEVWTTHGWHSVTSLARGLPGVHIPRS
jgi:hypothetical protein